MKIKFCGMTNLEDIDDAINLGVDYLGFVIDFPKSPRSISLEKFLDIARRIKQKYHPLLNPPPQKEGEEIAGGGRKKTPSVAKRVKVPKIVAVTVNISEDKLDKLLKSNLVDVLQFHGDESPDFCKRYKEKIEVWKSFKTESKNIQESCKRVEEFKDKADKFLMDASSGEDKGKEESKEFKNFELFKLLQSKNYPLILAGGLNPQNIKTYLEKLNPEIIDIASGVERYAGKKDKEKMKEIVIACRKQGKRICKM